MSGIFPTEVDPEVEFGIYSDEATDFLPRYYPERFTVTTEKDIERNAADFAGQRISIAELKNSDLHVTGKVTASNLDNLTELAESITPVEVIAPVFNTGAMEAMVKSVERGEVEKYDRFVGEWLFSYTIDLVSTGRDEYKSGKKPRYGPKAKSDSPDLSAKNDPKELGKIISDKLTYIDQETYENLTDPEYATIDGKNIAYLQFKEDGEVFSNKPAIPKALYKPDALNVREFKYLRDNGISLAQLEEDADLLKGDNALTLDEFIEYQENMEITEG